MADKYDDLDDFLDEFEQQDAILKPKETPKVAAETSEQPATADKSAAPTTAEEADGLGQLDEEFMKQLMLDTKELTSSLESDPDAQKGLEALLNSLGVGGPEGQKPTADDSRDKAMSFSDTIQRTAERVNESKAKASATDANSDDFLEKMLSELQSAAGAGPGGMDSMLASLMEELSSKEVLYDPLKEMHDKYPQWLAEHEAELEPTELSRYKNQQQIIAEIVLKFDDPSYSDNNKSSREFISQKMIEMQESGAPPQELVGDLAEGVLPGTGAPSDGPGDCPVQ